MTSNGIYTLADLLALADKGKTFGFDPSDVKIEFKCSGETLIFSDARACVSATAKDAKPVLTVTLTKPYTSTIQGR